MAAIENQPLVFAVSYLTIGGIEFYHILKK
jgi:hypothetical protein